MQLNTKLTVHIGADHGGFHLKEQLITWLQQEGYTVVDHGFSAYNPDDDYPEVAFKVAEAVTGNPTDTVRGILLCRSSGGVTIAANKVAGIRAVAATVPADAVHAVEHNNANVLTLPADGSDISHLQAIIDKFLNTAFSGEERHVRRLQLIQEYERKHEFLSSNID
jgi:ribose 5-phosphate isomerase B